MNYSRKPEPRPVKVETRIGEKRKYGKRKRTVPRSLYYLGMLFMSTVVAVAGYYVISDSNAWSATQLLPQEPAIQPLVEEPPLVIQPEEILPDLQAMPQQQPAGPVNLGLVRAGTMRVEVSPEFVQMEIQGPIKPWIPPGVIPPVEGSPTEAEDYGVLFKMSMALGDWEKLSYAASWLNENPAGAEVRDQLINDMYSVVLPQVWPPVTEDSVYAVGSVYNGLLALGREDLARDLLDKSVTSVIKWNELAREKEAQEQAAREAAAREQAELELAANPDVNPQPDPLVDADPNVLSDPNAVPQPQPEPVIPGNTGNPPVDLNLAKVQEFAPPPVPADINRTNWLMGLGPDPVLWNWMAMRKVLSQLYCVLADVPSTSCRFGVCPVYYGKVCEVDPRTDSFRKYANGEDAFPVSPGDWSGSDDGRPWFIAFTPEWYAKGTFKGDIRDMGYIMQWMYELID